jgi:hypothetical protein
MQLESKFTLLAKPKIAWGNHKIPTRYTWVETWNHPNAAILDG